MAVSLTSEEARQQAQAEGLMLLRAENKAGYFGVKLNNPGKPKPYQAQVSRGGKKVSLGNFAAAEEAALCIARLPEGRAAAGRAAAAAPLTSEREGKGKIPAMPSGAVVKEEQEEDMAPPVPPSIKEEGTVPPMPPDAFVKVEVVVKEEELSDGRLKRQRAQ